MLITRRDRTRGVSRSAMEPVYDGYFADPFVLRWRGRYYAYGTGPGSDSMAFPMLVSNDSRYWRAAGLALERIDPDFGPHYWAPEVIRGEDHFHMYYSVGTPELRHHIRVATSPSPLGPFRDYGRLTSDDLPFAIDPHPFRDPDGELYLYYAADYVDLERPGTMLVVQKMNGFHQLVGEPRLLLSAQFEWQTYEKNRPMYGRRLDWHTLEGPAIAIHKGRLYCFYSAGNWTNESYGVDYAVMNSPTGPLEGAGPTPKFLSSQSTGLIGPGHNSFFLGPEGVLHCALHAWDERRTKRQMIVAPVDWVGDKPKIRLEKPAAAKSV